MCPACLASAALAAGGVVSTGGIATLVVKALGFRRNGGDVSDDVTKRRTDNDNSDRKEPGDGGAAG